MKKKNSVVEMSANKFIGIEDIINSAIITDSGIAFSVFEVKPINADLLTPGEQVDFVKNLTGCLSAIRTPYKILAIPRPFDIQPYLDELMEQRRTAENDIVKSIVTEEMAELSAMVASGSVVEKFFYLIVWDEVDNDYTKSRMEISKLWEDGKVSLELLNKSKLLQLLNLFYNPSTEIYESDMMSSTFPTLNQEDYYEKRD